MAECGNWIRTSQMTLPAFEAMRDDVLATLRRNFEITCEQAGDIDTDTYEVLDGGATILDGDVEVPATAKDDGRLYQFSMGWRARKVA